MEEDEDLRDEDLLSSPFVPEKEPGFTLPAKVSGRCILLYLYVSIERIISGKIVLQILLLFQSQKSVAKILSEISVCAKQLFVPK